ncbi:hypothetical protein [Dysosmobacter sp.]|jgi:hypothetical protein|nr:hypothetical protein [uncultured Oscillibacter sp.]
MPLADKGGAAPHQPTLIVAAAAKSISGNFCPKNFFKKHLQFEKKLLY